MKRLNTYLLLLPILLVYSTCKKDTKVIPEDAPTVLSCDQNTPVFSRPINAVDTFYDIIEDLGRNIVVLGQKHLIKYDYQGNFVWSQSLNSPGIPQNIIQAEGDNYLVTNSTIDIKEHQPDEYYGNGMLGQKLNLLNYWKGQYTKQYWCYNYFEHTAKDFMQEPDAYIGVAKPTNNSHCYLTKFDKSGNILWSKTFDGNYFMGTSICKTTDGDYALLTYKLSGRYQTLEFDVNGVFQDTILRLIDQNSITIHKIGRDGNIKWSKTIEGITYWGDLSSYVVLSNHLSILSVQHAIYIQTQKQFFVLDVHGNVINTPKPYYEICKARPENLVSFNNTAYSLGRIGLQGIEGEVPYYCTSFDANGNVLEEKSMTQSLPYYPKSFLTTDGIISITGDYLLKTDRMGNNIWISPKDRIICGTKTCLDGIVFISTKTGSPMLIKTDPNGLY